MLRFLRSKALIGAFAFATFVTVAHAQEQPVAQPPEMTSTNISDSSGRMIEVMELLPTEPAADEEFIDEAGSETAPTSLLPPPTPITNQTAPMDPNAPPVDPNAPVDANALKPPISYNAVTLNGINKITARSEEISGALGTVLRFSNLEIIAHECQSIVDQNEDGFAALLEIWELKAGDTPKKILQGWMFSTSPSIFSLKHPLYDVSLKNCYSLEAESDASALPEKPADASKTKAPKKKTAE